MNWNMEHTWKINRNFSVSPTSNPSLTNINECERGWKITKNDNNWEQKRKKQKRASGLSYNLYKTCLNANEKQGHLLGEPCKGCCLKFDQNLTNEDKRELFKIYWGLGDIKKTASIFTQCTNKWISKTSQIKKRDRGYENASLTYYLNNKNVCQTMFLNMFNISPRVVQTAMEKILMESS